MRLLYYKGSHPNFGDELNVLLWPKLAPALFDDPDGDGFIGIGTIIGMLGTDARRLHVFSSGVGYRAIDSRIIGNCRFWCVRGPISARLLGLDPDVALTDGAILTPAILPAPEAARRDIVVVPHWETLLANGPRHGWRKACALAGMTLLDPRQPPESIIPRIAGARLVLAESLHAAIIADAYGVPWIAFASSANILVLKWLDWALSVNVRLRIRSLRPPDTALLSREGRPWRRPWGSCAEPDEAAATAAFGRTDCSPAAHAPDAAARMKQWLRQRVDRSPCLQSLLGFSPSATADALTKLAQGEPSLSAEPVRKRLAERMAARLDALIREQATMQPALIG